MSIRSFSLTLTWPVAQDRFPEPFAAATAGRWNHPSASARLRSNSREVHGPFCLTSQGSPGSCTIYLYRPA